MTPNWVRDAVFYQIFPDRLSRGERPVEVGRFQNWDDRPNFFGFKGGTLWGVIDELPRLEDMGFNALYFTPIFSSPANHRYHTHDYLQVDPILGGNEAFDALLEAAHKKNFKVVLDGVFNHTGRSFFAFGHIMENGLESPYLDWYEINKDFLQRTGTLNAYPGHVQEKSVKGFDSFGYNAWWDLPALPKLNVHNAEVREFLLKVAEHWVRKGIDGWRLDVPTEITAQGFWEEFRTRVKAINPNCYIVGEIWYPAPEYLRGDRFDGLMNYPLGTAAMAFFLRKLDRPLASRSAFRGFPEVQNARLFIDEVKRVLEYAGEDVMFSQLNLFTSHDTPRLQDLGSFEIQDCLQAFVFLMSVPGAPCVYYGEEYALHGGHDPLCRGTIPTELKETPPPFYASIRSLIRLRQEVAALRNGSIVFVHPEDWPDKAFYFDRVCDSGCARVFINASSTPIVLEDTFVNGFHKMHLINGIKFTTLPSTELAGMVVPSHASAIITGQ